jgi:c-di-GMP-binding flagellar brake protein YcgR
VTDGVDKRDHHRIRAGLDVRVLPSEDLPPDLVLTTIDVSVGGARCASNVPVKEGLRLMLTFTLVGGTLHAPAPVDVDALVVRCIDTPGPNPSRRYELALRFVDVDPDEKRRLQSYLNSL